MGGTLRTLLVPDRSGELVDVVLGCDTLEDYLAQPDYLGALVGRYANRIAGGQFTLRGETFQLTQNDGKNHIHGGFSGFFHRVWQVASLTENQVALTLRSHDGEEGYPGDLDVCVTYCLNGSSLSIRYEAVSDRATICSLTNHAYFNLSGHGSGSVEDQMVTIFADSYTPTTQDGLPCGRLEPVEGTLMDMRRPTVIGQRVSMQEPQIRIHNGFDHNFVLNGPTGVLHPAAWAQSSETGITMKLETTLPGLQFYTGNFLQPGRPGKQGTVYGPRQGFCLETEFFPDAPNNKNFPSPILLAGQKYCHESKITFEKSERGEH